MLNVECFPPNRGCETDLTASIHRPRPSGLNSCPFSSTAGILLQKLVMDDWQLLREYAEHGSETAFTNLVQRHVDMVYASALRQLRDPHLAKDAAQAVFILLARKAASLRSSVVLSGWLYRTTVHVASRALRDRIRQQRREEEVAQMNFNESAEELWGKMVPHLDGAISELNAIDRDAVVLRFLQQRSFHDVGD